MKRKASISHDEAIVRRLRKDSEFAAEYLKAGLEANASLCFHDCVVTLRVAVAPVAGHSRESGNPFRGQRACNGLRSGFPRARE